MKIFNFFFDQIHIEYIDFQEFSFNYFVMNHDSNVR